MIKGFGINLSEAFSFFLNYAQRQFDAAAFAICFGSCGGAEAAIQFWKLTSPRVALSPGIRVLLSNIAPK